MSSKLQVFNDSVRDINLEEDTEVSQKQEEEERIWQQELRTSIKHKVDLEHYLTLTDEEHKALDLLESQGGLPLGITSHLLSLIDPSDPNDPIRRQFIPHQHEWKQSSWARRDPLGEEAHETVPFLVHRYPDRALLLVTDRCASYCRFCTRKRLVGQGPTPTQNQLQQALDYLHQKSTIHDVILSGGDALLLNNTKLSWLLHELSTMPHINTIRIATRMLTFLPHRITHHLCNLLAQHPDHQSIHLLSHINHPREMTPLTIFAAKQLMRAGILIWNQTVLLREVNDDVETLRSLFMKLLHSKIRPYYLHQCDLVEGTEHLRVPLHKAVGLYRQLRGNISGLALPAFIIDIPGGQGKVSLGDIDLGLHGNEDESILLQGFKGEPVVYPWSE